jgi:hypothetical protein
MRRPIRMWTKTRSVAVFTVSVIAATMGSSMVASAIVDSAKTDPGMTVAGPDGKPIVAADGTVIRINETQLDGIPAGPSHTAIIDQAKAKELGLDDSAIGTEGIEVTPVVIWQLIGEHPASQDQVNKTLTAATTAKR